MSILSVSLPPARQAELVPAWLSLVNQSSDMLQPFAEAESEHPADVKREDMICVSRHLREAAGIMPTCYELPATSITRFLFTDEEVASPLLVSQMLSRCANIARRYAGVLGLAAQRSDASTDRIATTASHESVSMQITALARHVRQFMSPFLHQLETLLERQIHERMVMSSDLYVAAVPRVTCSVRDRAVRFALPAVSTTPDIAPPTVLFTPASPPSRGVPPLAGSISAMPAFHLPFVGREQTTGRLRRTERHMDLRTLLPDLPARSMGRR